MNAEFVRPVLLGNGDVLPERGLELLDVAFVINPFLKCANEPRRDADDIRHPVPLQLQRNEQVLQDGCRLIGFIHTDFDLERPAVHDLGDVPAQMTDVFECPAVLPRGVIQTSAVKRSANLKFFPEI